MRAKFLPEINYPPFIEKRQVVRLKDRQFSGTPVKRVLCNSGKPAVRQALTTRKI
jgi:hypothetical protein